MITRNSFVCLYLSSFFIANRWFDLHQYYTKLSTDAAFSSSHLPICSLTTKQLQHVLNVRGISYGHIHEKTDLIQLVEQTGIFQYTVELLTEIIVINR